MRARNAETAQELEGSPAYETLETNLLRILDSDAKIPFVEKDGDWFYNFWKDAKHPRGLWRRTTPKEFREAAPAWETVLDIDNLNTTEKESWVFQGAAFLKPKFGRCLVSLSRGGSDAVVIREFNVETKTFVKDGFSLSEAKSAVSWIDENTLFVGTDFGPGSLTTSGYPREARIWMRGSPLSQAKLVFEGKESDMEVQAYHDPTKGFERDFIICRPSFFTAVTYQRGGDGSLRRIDVPEDAIVSSHREWLLVQPRTPWNVNGRTYSAGSLLAAPFDAYMTGQREITVLFEPTATTSLDSYNWTWHRLILNVLDDVKNRLEVLTPGPGGWTRERLMGAPAIGSVGAWALDPDESDAVFMVVTDFLTPTALHLGIVGESLEKVKESPSFFDASGLEVSQHFVRSKDGTRIPYFQVSPRDLKLDRSNPTLLVGYGGFEISMLPYYDALAGKAWLSRGGVLVVANIRGGGEYGPRWHQAALKAKRLRCYEDFASVAQDLVTRHVTSTKHLGIKGGSNGGLLVGNMITLYPQLCGAAVCLSPLLDMRRYTLLLAGASWIEEYGDPDKPEEWEFLKTFSPYHNLR